MFVGTEATLARATLRTKGDDMRLLVYTAVAMLVGTTTLHADLHVTQRSHTDSYYYGGRTTPARDVESELWIGSGRIALVSADRKVIVDRTRNTLTFVNRRDSTFAEAPLPFEWAKFVDEDLSGTLARYRTHGTVEPATPSQKLEWECSGYAMTSWIDTDSGKYNERDSKVWVTRDLPVDWDEYRALNLHLLRLLNYDDDLVARLDEISGFVVRTESQRFIHGFSVGSVEEVVDVREATPGPDVYRVPESFKKKETLTMADLRG